MLDTPAPPQVTRDDLLPPRLGHLYRGTSDSPLLVSPDQGDDHQPLLGEATGGGPPSPAGRSESPDIKAGQPRTKYRRFK